MRRMRNMKSAYVTACASCLALLTCTLPDLSQGADKLDAQSAREDASAGPVVCTTKQDMVRLMALLVSAQDSAVAEELRTSKDCEASNNQLTCNTKQATARLMAEIDSAQGRAIQEAVLSNQNCMLLPNAWHVLTITEDKAADQPASVEIETPDGIKHL
jgi:hypothetical protein